LTNISNLLEYYLRVLNYESIAFATDD